MELFNDNFWIGFCAGMVATAIAVCVLSSMGRI